MTGHAEFLQFGLGGLDQWTAGVVGQQLAVGGLCAIVLSALLFSAGDQ